MKKYAMLSLMAVLALGACDDDDDDSLGPSNSAEIRVVNASTGVPSVGLFRGGDQLIGGVGFQTASSCSNLQRVPSGQQTLEFRATAGGTTKLVPATFTAGQRYTVVLYGPSNNLQAVVLQDQQTTVDATAGNNRLRFINATGTAGNIFWTTATGTIAGTANVANLAAGASTTGASMYQNVATTNVRFRLTDVGSTTARGDFTIDADDLPDSRNATIVFTDAATGGTVTGFQINECD